MFSSQVPLARTEGSPLAVGVMFFGNGFVMAFSFSRMPGIRDQVGATPTPGLRVGLRWDRINRGDAVYGPARQSLFVQNGQQGGHEYLPERMGNTPDGRFRPDARSDVADRRAGNRHRRCRDERAPASLRLTSASFQPGKPDMCVASGAHGQSLASFRNTAAGFFPYGNSWLMRPEAQSWSCSRWNGTCGRHGFSSQAMRP